MTWPLQKDCDAFYGDPRGANGQPNPTWMTANLTKIFPPYTMTYAGKPVASVTIHHKCAASLLRVFDAIWDAAKHDQKTVDEWGASIFGGTFAFRQMRGLNTLSMHSYACAIDLDPARNTLASANGHFKQCQPVLDAFAAEGWTWGGSWRTRPDPMHFRQLA